MKPRGASFLKVGLLGQHEGLGVNQHEALRQGEHIFQSLRHCTFGTGKSS